MNGRNHLSLKKRSETRDHAMNHYEWKLLNLIQRKNIKRTKSAIQILNQRKNESPGIATKNVYAKKEHRLLQIKTV